jgi:hypothetical protein
MLIVDWLVERTPTTRFHGYILTHEHDFVPTLFKGRIDYSRCLTCGVLFCEKCGKQSDAQDTLTKKLLSFGIGDD